MHKTRHFTGGKFMKTKKRDVREQTFEEITRPLREAAKKIREEDVDRIIHEFRQSQKCRKE